MAVPQSNILLIGAGKMGGALLSAWLRAGIPSEYITVVERQQGKSLTDVTVKPDCIVLAVKPQSMDALLPELAKQFGDKPLYLSIAAGKTIPYFEKYLGSDAAIIRAMPNTPALIGQGISALYANGKVTNPQKNLADSLLKAAGETVWLEDESYMDAVTAISGSGPAYVFLVMEAMIEAGMKQALPETMAQQLTMQTLLGSAQLAKLSPESIAQLRNNVTSPGGTTEAALNILTHNDALKSLFAEAVVAAVKRSRELV